ncbi:MAG: HAMP domain-containing histidine kinase [Acidobacteriota bacterium]|nr:HAMP domain-containing histidine kinase [Acidobacteriota bacterium]
MSPRRSFRPYLLVTALACVLIVLAFVQYRWSEQVSAAERQQMRASLQIAVGQFRQEFTREMGTLCAGLQPEGDAVDSGDWDRVARQQAEWLHSAADASLVSAVYLWKNQAGGSLARLDAISGTFAPAQEPPELESLLAQFRQQFDSQRDGRPPRPMTWIMDARGPSLLHMLFAGGDGPERGAPGQGSTAAGMLVVHLNRESLERTLLPDLAKRYFAGPDGFVYQAVVYAGEDTTHPVYTSGGPLTGAADMTVDVLEFRPRGGGPERGGHERGPGGPARPSYPYRERMRGGGRGFWMGMQPGMLMSDAFAPWKLAVRHRSGSLDRAVEELRWRNLAISFAILLVLGAGMVSIVRSTQRARRLAELQMQFVAGVSHELRTPLAVISSAAQNLNDGIVEGKPQVKQYGALIRSESLRLAGMMEQILQFAAGEKNRAYKPTLLEAGSLIDGALALSKTVLDEGGFTVKREIAPDLPQVRGEGGALTQCLQNLVSNAAKYSGESRWIGIRAWAADQSVWIAVEDRGIGIEKQELPHVFDAFYRARAVRSAQIHGTGLGLNLARSFARDAGGDLTVESAPGKGSCFTVRLPAEGPRLLERSA